MLLISLFITFLLEFFFTPREDYLQKYGERVAVWFYGKFDTGSKNIAIISWLLILFLCIFVVWLLWTLVVFVHPVLGFVFFIGILFFNLGFKRYLNKFVNISKHLKNGDIELARSALGNWASSVKKDEVLHDVIINGNTQQIARETIKLVVTSLHRNLFGPVFWLCFLPGPVGLVLYKFAMITQQETFRFNQSKNREKLDCSEKEILTDDLNEILEKSDTDAFSEIADRAFFWIDWLPSRATSLVFAVVGNFEDAYAMGRYYSIQSSDKNSSLNTDAFILAAGEGAMMLSLSIPTAISGDKQLDTFEEEVTKLDLPEPDVNSMKVAVGLMWRSLILWIVILTLVSFGYVLNVFY